MTERWPHLAGLIDGPVHRLAVRVYYEDTDFSGYVYHANYLKFCERGRSDWLRLLGVHHHQLQHAESGPAHFVVRRMVCDFVKPARIDEVLEVETRVAGLRGARMELDQRVVRDGAVLFQAAVTAALVDARGRPKRLPKGLNEALMALAQP